MAAESTPGAVEQLRLRERLAKLRELPLLRGVGVSGALEQLERQIERIAAPPSAEEVWRAVELARPTAIFARNDFTAIGALQALTEAGVRTPEDIAVAGFDNIPLAAAMTPTLTTVSQPTEEEGRLATEFLLERIERPQRESGRREIVLECSLIVRASTVGRR